MISFSFAHFLSFHDFLSALFLHLYRPLILVILTKATVRRDEIFIWQRQGTVHGNGAANMILFSDKYKVKDNDKYKDIQGNGA